MLQKISWYMCIFIVLLIFQQSRFLEVKFPGVVDWTVFPSPNSYIEDLTFSILECELICKWGHCRHHKLRKGYQCGPDPTWLVSLLKRDIWTQRQAQRRIPYKDQVKHWEAASASQECQRLPANEPKGRRESWNRFFPIAPEGINLADTLILGFQPSELWGKTFLLLKPPSCLFFILH